MNNPLVLESDRLILTWPTKEQIKQYYEDIINTNMFDTILWEGPKEVKELNDYWKHSIVDTSDLGLELNFAIIDKKTNLYIGGCSLRPVNKDPAIIDVGIALAPKYHNSGFGTEALKLIVNEAFLNRKAIRVFGTVFVGNLASRKMFEKLDFKLEGTLRSVVLKRDKWLDEWVLAITKDDWKQSKVYS